MENIFDSNLDLEFCYLKDEQIYFQEMSYIISSFERNKYCPLLIYTWIA